MKARPTEVRYLPKGYEPRIGDEHGDFNVRGAAMSVTNIFLVLYVVVSLATMGAYAWDKSAAGRGKRRIRERTLHAMEVLGGWPGALLAQQLFRHKRRKLSFLLVTWLIAAAHVGVWVSAFMR